MANQTAFRACNLCEAVCGLTIEHDGTKVISIKGDKEDPLSRGHICPKAIALQDIHADPDRLRTLTPIACALRFAEPKMVSSLLAGTKPSTWSKKESETFGANTAMTRLRCIWVIRRCITQGRCCFKSI